MVLGILLTCCIGRPSPSLMPAPASDLGSEAPLAVESVAADSPPPQLPDDDFWYQAVAAASRGSQRAAAATTAEDWSQVAQAWGEAVVLLQTIPADDPRQGFSQRKAREYLQNLQIAQARAEQKGLERVFPTLGSPVLDEQVSLYQSYVATLGAPDVLIVGSSRSLQGIDPQVLQQALAYEGRPGLRVYNFSVNGATAQVVSFILRRLLAEDLHPRLVIWAEGSRAFNSGRFDRTFAEILASPGYAAVAAGAQLTTQPAPDQAAAAAPKPLGTVPVSLITAQGFLPVNDQFNPRVYYQTFPQVRGAYDNAYRPFRLAGLQTDSLNAVTEFLKSRQIPLVFVNLPLSDDYLDPVRLGYELQFQAFLQGQAQAGAMTVVDLLETWRWQSHLFADPSHVNRYGAREVARLLAADGRVPWPQVTQDLE